jgi:hypothetical protein
MRRFLYTAATAAVFVSTACASPPARLAEASDEAQTKAVDQNRFAGAERLDDAELRRLLPGMRAINIDASLYRGIEEEHYGNRPGKHALSLRERDTYNWTEIFYDLGRSIGSYRVYGNALCSIIFPETIERCRNVFRLADGTYALSTFEDPSRPAIRLELNRSAGR